MMRLGNEPKLALLLALRAYMLRLHPEIRDEATLPLEFWKIPDDELFFEALGYLPSHIGVTESGDVPGLDEIPEGFRLAFPIFRLEDDYAFNGWTALTNAGTWMLPAAIAAFDRIGLTSEARALEAALRACERDPDDADAAEAAYKSVANPYADDEGRHAALLAFFRSNSHLFESQA